MIAQTVETKQHTLAEIKRQPQKTFCPVTTRLRLNRALAEIISFNGDDTYFYNYLVESYLKALDLYHVNGRSGSLLPQAVQV